MLDRLGTGLYIQEDIRRGPLTDPETSGRPIGKHRWKVPLLGALLALSALASTLSAAGPAAPPLLRLDLSSYLAKRSNPVALSDAQNAPGGAPARAETSSKWPDRLRLSGALAADARWLRKGAVPGFSPTTVSDLFLRMFDLALEADFSDWASATVVLNSEWIGDSLNQGDGTVVVDEARLDVAIPHSPVYFSVGKRSQPIGQFEASLITDPMTQDAYEAKAVGVTVGIRAPLSTDFSATLYKGRVLWDHVAQSRLFDPTAAPAQDVPVSRADSWILSGTTTPVKDTWTVFAAFASEPGLDRRITTIDLGTSFSPPGVKSVEVDAEYMRGLRRDVIPGLGQSFRESVLSVTASYQFVRRPRMTSGNRSYRARREHRFAHPIEVSLRFEAFTDGSRAESLGSWSVKNRLSAAGRYTFFDRGNVLIALSAEYRKQTLRVSPVFGGIAAPTDEFCLRLGLDF
jgi:hypothetical protein